MSSSSSDSDLEFLMNGLDSSSSDSENEITTRRPRNYKERINYLQIMEDAEFKMRFRLSKGSVEGILCKIGQVLAPATNRNHALSPTTQILIALRYYALGTMLLAVGDFIGVSKQTASEVVWKVSKEIAALKNEYIKMENSADIKEKFYNVARFPCVIGALGCTHIKIQSIGGPQAEVFRNRNGFFSLNVQCVCDADMLIRNIVVKSPGSTHDNMIFNSSTLKQRFENGEFEDSFLVADSGYPTKKYLMTPLDNPRLPEEILYNESQIQTRNVIERCFDVWKRRFPILYLSLRLNIDRAQTVIVATAVLHNICILEKEELQPVEIPMPLDQDNNNMPPPICAAHIENGVRNDLIVNYFNSLN